MRNRSNNMLRAVLIISVAIVVISAFWAGIGVGALK